MSLLLVLYRSLPKPMLSLLVLQAARGKIVKKDGAAPSEIEAKVAQEIANIEASNTGLKSALRTLYISSAREIEVDGGRKAIVVVVPFPLLADFKLIQKQLVEELEKKLSVSLFCHVIIVFL